MSWFEIALRIGIILFGIWALVNSILIGYALWRKSQDED
jgi:hypothetical protein